MKKTGVVTLVVSDQGALETVAAGRAAPDSTLMIVISNEHATDDFKVTIKDFKRKETMAAALPLVGAPSHFRLVHPGEVDFIRVKVLPAASFGAGGLPYTTYKYTVEIANMTTGAPPVPIDPELDVCPP